VSGEVLDFWRPEMIGRFTAKGLAAVDEFKKGET
jgi:hypothetical protein